MLDDRRPDGDAARHGEDAAADSRGAGSLSEGRGRLPGESDLAAVLWDMDGTLVDSEPQWVVAQRQLVEAAGGSWSDDDGLRLVGADMPTTIAALRAAGVGGDDDATLQATLVSRVLHSMRRRLLWRPGALELHRALAAADIPQAIVTTAPRGLADHVATQLAARLGGPVPLVVSGDDVTRSKPHPEPYLRVSHRLGVDISACVAIEDSAVGAQSAATAGAAVLCVPHRTVVESVGRGVIRATLVGVTIRELRELARHRHRAR